mgnify:CR=1 FL=1
MRRTPYEIAFGPDAEPRFELLRESLARGGRDPHDADAFVLDPEVVRYLRELVPEEGVGEAVAEHVALLHHAYLYWASGGWLLGLSRERAQALLTTGLPLPPGDTAPPATYYVQFPERVVWAALAPDEPHQPLDGLFVRPWPGGGLFALAVFGLHPGQAGFSVVAVDGYPPVAPVRADGAPLFAPVLAGGAAAGLHSITGEEELLELAARTVPLAAESRACAGASHRPHQAVELGSLS